MLRSIWEDAKREFQYGNMVTRLILINLVVFLLVHVVKITLYIGNGATPSGAFQQFLHFFSMSSDWRFVVTHPWTLVTSMFLHEGVWHILWNMIFLYWFGRIVGDFLGNRRVFPIYFLGGLAGVIFFYVSANLLPYSGGVERFALGASAGVMAIVVASGVIAPDYIMRLLFLGDVKLKYIVFALVFLDLVGIGNDMNTGGHFAHLGGALMGWLMVSQLKNGTDWSQPINRILTQISSLFERKAKRPKVVFTNKNRPSSSGKSASRLVDSLNRQEKVDAILDKIKKSGYSSLSKEEKAFLFEASKED
ncbi:MAG: rhomboid family intramembrane serine protease [Saprospiraceae bacterium]|jgi:membrane associated rhomboid family serine protease